MAVFRRLVGVACLVLVIACSVAALVPISSGVPGAPSCGNSLFLSPVMREQQYGAGPASPASICQRVRGDRRHETFPWFVLGLVGLATVSVLELSARFTPSRDAG